MRNKLLVSVALLMLLPAFPASGDGLPLLPSSSPEQLPSVSTVTIRPVQDQNISVTCYLGNPNDRNSLGEIMVHSATEAGTICNAMNFACRGNCFGCFSDFDLSQDICVDASGKKFLW